MSARRRQNLGGRAVAACCRRAPQDRRQGPAGYAGMVDIHANILVNASDMAGHTDDFCRASGVTTLRDADSTVSATFPGLRQVIDREVGTRITRGEVTGWGQPPSGGKAAERSRIAAVAQPVAEMLDAEPAVEAARRAPVKHLKIDPLPAALDGDGGKPGHQPPADPLSARRLGDKKIFKIHPGSAEPSREPGVEQGKTGGLAVEKGEQRLELPLGSEAIAAQIFFGGDDSVGRSFVSGQIPDQPQQ